MSNNKCVQIDLVDYFPLFSESKRKETQNIKPKIKKQTLSEVSHGFIKGIGFKGTGMAARYLGAFTRIEEEFIKATYSQLNNILDPNCSLYLVHYKKDGVIKGLDVSLFCGGCKLGTIRIDVKKESEYTIRIRVQKFLQICKNLGVKINLMIIDAPYSLDKDKKMYNTYHYNKYSDYRLFIQKIVKNCLEILSPGGILISKNWRALNLKNSNLLFRLFTFYGGRRRITIFEGWQYRPNKPKNQIPFQFHWFEVEKELNRTFQMKKEAPKIDWIPTIRWLKGKYNSWSDQEIQFINIKLKKCSPVDKVAIITESKDYHILQGLFSKSNLLDLDQFFEENEKFNVLILDSYPKIGGSITKTNKFKELAEKYIKKEGLLFTKTYFDLSLDPNKWSKRTVEKKIKNEENLPKFDLKGRRIVIYDNYHPIDLLSCYKRK
ncbi:MAG: hypothetical protein EAX96_06470 [Candidatus Lokiarchaeota archaeon]|nr:hypothetical protein [Candidatus Lokiarchaeota archaeon]